MAVDTIAKMACVTGTSDWESMRDALGVAAAAVNQNVHWCCKTRNLEVHAPSTTRVSSCGAHLVSVSCDEKCVAGLM
jgi:hypothetical protein